jgi:hypothetical protein
MNRWLAVAVALLVAPPAVARSADAVESLAWLAGCWASLDGEPGSGEQWTAPAGGTLLGMSRTVAGGRTVAHEFLQIREVSPGKLAYVAQPSGQAATVFALLRSGPREVVFENPDHDFPQRILYRLDGEGVLRARIEGVGGGKLQGVDFPMRRVACAAP